MSVLPTRRSAPQRPSSDSAVRIAERNGPGAGNRPPGPMHYVGYPIDIRKPEVNDRLHRSLRSQRGGCRCDLFVHDGPSRCVHVVLVEFRRSLT